MPAARVGATCRLLPCKQATGNGDRFILLLRCASRVFDPRMLARAGSMSTAIPARRSEGGHSMTAIGKGFIATLSTDMRGPVERRSATSRSQAFVKARLLLDAAERRAWN
jgi:hypothetical protein